VVSLEEDDLLVFNYLCASEIWSDKRGERGLIRGVVSLEEEDLLLSELRFMSIFIISLNQRHEFYFGFFHYDFIGIKCC
jgi:hypothetical protein